jgi:hypothetical protein
MRGAQGARRPREAGIHMKRRYRGFPGPSPIHP